MIWLTWRQFRAQIVLTFAVLAVLAIVLADTGLNLAHLYDTSGIGTCKVNGGPNVNCAVLASHFLGKLTGITPILYFVGIGLLFAAPGIIGLFWGAPLVTREFEARTYRLAWNQSVTRTRWLAVKLAVVGLAAMATAGLLSLMLTWWSGPIDSAAAVNPGRGISLVRVGPVLFDVRGITPIGYAAFAFALGVTAGVLIRRTLPAMAATLAGFAIVQIVMPKLVRQHLIAPVRAIVALNPADIDGVRQGIGNSMNVLATPSYTQERAWMLSSQIINSSDDQAFHGAATRACLGSSFQRCQASIGSLHLRQLITYQPASRFWAFQRDETAIFLALALLLAGACIWWISRRRVA